MKVREPSLRGVWVSIAAVVALVLLAVADFLFSEIHVGALALVALLVLAYYGSRALALAVSLASAVVFAALDHDLFGAHVIVKASPVVDGIILAFTFALSILIADRFRQNSIANALLKRDLEAMRRSADRDFLTDLPNREAFNKRLDEAMRGIGDIRSGAAVLFADLDGFKAINDTHGHHIGDTLLAMAGKRLSNALRAPDFVARIGGDEFGVIVDRFNEPRDIDRIARAIESSFIEPFADGTRLYQIGVTIGTAIAPIDAADATSLVQVADARMYERKRLKGSGRANTLLADGGEPA